MNLDILYDQPQILPGRQMLLGLRLQNHGAMPIVNLSARVEVSGSLLLLSARNILVAQIKPGAAWPVALKFNIQGNGPAEVRLEKLNYRCSGLVQSLPDWSVQLETQHITALDPAQIQVVRLDRNELRQNENNRVVILLANESELDWPDTSLEVGAEVLGIQQANLNLGLFPAGSSRMLELQVCPPVSGAVEMDLTVSIPLSSGLVQKQVCWAVSVQRDERNSSTTIQDSVITGREHHIGANSQGTAFTGLRESAARDGKPVAPGGQTLPTCPNCGSQVSHNFCDQCGFRLEGGKGKEENE